MTAAEKPAPVGSTRRQLALAGIVVTAMSAAAEEAKIPELPLGEGRQEVVETCSACHSLRLVVQQRLSQEVWDETLDWMVAEQGMPALEPLARRRILNYLSTHLNPTTPR